MQLLQMAGSRANLLLQTVASSLTLRSVHSIGCSTSKGLDTSIGIGSGVARVWQSVALATPTFL